MLGEVSYNATIQIFEPKVLATLLSSIEPRRSKLDITFAAKRIASHRMDILMQEYFWGLGGFSNRKVQEDSSLRTDARVSNANQSPVPVGKSPICRHFQSPNANVSILHRK